MAVTSLLTNVIANNLYELLRERLAGPRTPESTALVSEADALEATARDMLRTAETKREQSFAARRKAKSTKPTWFKQNREALVVNLVASIITGVPFTVLGFWLAKAFG